MFVIGFYLLLTQVAHAANGKPSPEGTPETSPSIKPGKSVIFSASPTNERTTNMLAGLASSFCSTGITSGDFWIGGICGLVVIAGMRMVKPD